MEAPSKVRVCTRPNGNEIWTNRMQMWISLVWKLLDKRYFGCWSRYCVSLWKRKRREKTIGKYKHKVDHAQCTIQIHTLSIDIDEAGDFLFFFLFGWDCVRFCSHDIRKNWNIQTFKYSACHWLNSSRDRCTNPISDDINACLPPLVWAASSTQSNQAHLFIFSVQLALSLYISFSRQSAHWPHTSFSCVVVHRMLFRPINFVLIASKLAFTYTSMSNDNEIILFIQRSHFFGMQFENILSFYFLSLLLLCVYVYVTVCWTIMRIRVLTTEK